MTLGNLYEWELPEIKYGTHALSKIIVEPDTTIKESISYLESENILKYDGSPNLSTSLVDKLYFIKITLENVRGEKSEF